MLICFFDFQQRPSRSVVLELSRKADLLQRQEVAVLIVQTGKTDRGAFDVWWKESRLSVPVGVVEGDRDEVHFAWGVKAVPWLVLTDEKHNVVAEGFGVGELNGKIESCVGRN